MKVTVESLICEWDDSAVHAFVRFCNIILLQPDLKSLESALNLSPYRDLYKEHFEWVFTSSYFRVYQINPYTLKPNDFSLLSIEF